MTTGEPSATNEPAALPGIEHWTRLRNTGAQALEALAEQQLRAGDPGAPPAWTTLDGDDFLLGPPVHAVQEIVGFAVEHGWDALQPPAHLPFQSLAARARVCWMQDLRVEGAAPLERCTHAVRNHYLHLVARGVPEGLRWPWLVASAANSRGLFDFWAVHWRVSGFVARGDWVDPAIATTVGKWRALGTVGAMCAMAGLTPKEAQALTVRGEEGLGYLTTLASLAGAHVLDPDFPTRDS